MKVTRAWRRFVMLSEAEASERAIGNKNTSRVLKIIPARAGGSVGAGGVSKSNAGILLYTRVTIDAVY